MIPITNSTTNIANANNDINISMNKANDINISIDKANDINNSAMTSILV